MIPAAANFCALKDPHGEIYIMTWDDGRHMEAIQRACDWADNPELSFTWKHARKFAQKIREVAKEARRA